MYGVCVCVGRTQVTQHFPEKIAHAAAYRITHMRVLQCSFFFFFFITKEKRNAVRIDLRFNAVKSRGGGKERKRKKIVSRISLVAVVGLKESKKKKKTVYETDFFYMYMYTHTRKTV